MIYIFDPHVFVGATGVMINRVLAGLETLDRHNFERVETNNSLDILYHKLFSSQPYKDNNDVKYLK